MAPSYERWTVSGYTRPVMDQLPNGEWWPDRDRSERVAVISDPRGWLWEVVVEGEKVEAITLRPVSGRKLDHRTLKAAPLGYLRDAAVSFWRSVDAELSERDDAINMTPVAEVIEAMSGEVAQVLGKPTLEDFALEWTSTPKNPVVAGRQTTRREALRQRYRRPDGTPVSLATIDAWTREARTRGLIEPATTGRGNKTPGAN